MSFLKLTWCQLIKIILSQIGGNPLQQIYSQLNQGKPTMAPGGLLPQGLQDLKNFIETITATINAAQKAANDFTDTVEKMAQEFYINPVGAITGATITEIDGRVARIDAQLAEEQLTPGSISPADLQKLQSEKIFLVGETGTGGLRSEMNTFLDNTDRLAGVRPTTSAGQSGCSLQDLLGSGCSPNQEVPDVDIQDLINSFKRGDLIAAAREQIKNATGISDLQNALASFRFETQSFNNLYLDRINRAALRSAITGQITQMVFNLLSGCGNTVLDLTLKQNVKDAITPYVAALEQQREGEAYFDQDGELVSEDNLPENKSFAPPVSDVVVNTDLGNTIPQRYYLDGIEVSKEVHDKAKDQQITREDQAINPLLKRKRDIELYIAKIERDIKDLNARERELVGQASTTPPDQQGQLGGRIQGTRDSIINRQILLSDARRILAEINVKLQESR
jgi:hypothetical protein